VGLAEELDALLVAFDDPAAIYAACETPRADRTAAPRPSGGDALMLLLWTAARVNDALSFTERAYNGETLIYRQTKTRRVVEVPVLGPLADRLPAMQRRRRAQWGDAAPDELVVNEDDGAPYWRLTAKGVRYHRPFNDLWRERRTLAGLIAPSLVGDGVDRLGDPLPAFNAQDCRDTAVTRLMEAGCDIFQIASWHGSDPKDILDLVKHYIAIGPDKAREAGDKLIAHARENGISV
ncbi:MAG: hypothetical protein AAGJ87_17125, partial [Pseudomonadota bacterium]